MDIVTLMKEHEDAVALIREKVTSFSRDRRYFRVYRGSTSTTRPVNFSKDAIVDVSGMTRVFPVDTDSMTVKVEPNVPMDALVAHCIKAGVVPKVVMEFKGITAGGGFSGMSGESSMYKHGLFQNTVPEIEIVLGDGSVVMASRTQNEDLLREAGGSLGTFGVVTLVTVELVTAKSHVEVTVHPIPDPFDIPGVFGQVVDDPNVDYVDGILFNRDSGVVMLGKLVDHADRNRSGILLEKGDVHWFADFVRAHVARHENHNVPTLLLPLTDYLFRYDHGVFWGGELVFQHFHIPRNRITKWMADPLLDSRTCYHALHKTGLADEYVAQDFGLPESTAKQFMLFVLEKLPSFRLFLCPLKPASEIGIHRRFSSRIREVQDQRIVGVGVYGRGPKDAGAFVKLNRELEAYAHQCLGTKLLYARTYFDEAEFWEIYDKEYYDEMREKYHATWLPSIYDKLMADMSRKSPKRAVRGVLETISDKLRGKRDYLLL